jgi:hypothetical protein
MAAVEKRRSPRSKVVLRASVARDNGWSKQEIVVQTLNLSRTGAMLQTPEQLLPGELCTLIPARPDGGYGYLPARIVWIGFSRNGTYRAGVAFRDLSPDLERLIERHIRNDQ